MKYIILLIIFNFISNIIIPNEITQFVRQNFLDKDYINRTILEKNWDCIENFINNPKYLLSAFSNSGKFLGDFGFEEECLYNNNNSNNQNNTFKYYLLNFSLNFSSFVNTTQFKQLYFKNISNYFVGLCNLEICENLTSELLKDKNFTKFLVNEAGILNEIYILKSDDLKKNNNIFFYTFITILLSYIIFISLIQIIEPLKKEKKIQIIKNILKNEEYLRDSEIEFIDENSENINTDKNKNLYTKKQCEKKLIKYYCFFNFDLIYNIKNLFNIINDVFIEKGLEKLTFIRFIMQYLVIYYFNIISLKYFPPKDQFQKNFYNGFFFVFLNKNCSFALIGYIILDASLMSYKLMSYIRRHYVYQGNTELDFPTILKFSYYLIPKFFTFVLIYLIFYIFGSYLNNFDFGTLFNFYHNFILENTLDNLNWFEKYIFPYKDFKSPFKNDNTVYSFLFVNIIINEFFSYIIVLILIYFSFKMKNNLYDKILLYSNLLLFFLIPFLLFLTIDIESLRFNMNLLYGQYYCFKCLIFFFPFYYLGTIVGIGYFFEKDNHSNITLEFTLTDEEGCNIPTMINYQFIKKFCVKNNLLKKILFYFTAITIVFIINIPFYIKSKKIFNNDDVDIDFDIENFKIKKDNFLDLLLYFYFIYEKTIYGFLFMALISLFLFYPKDDILYKIMLLHIFIPFQRLSHVFLCFSEVIVFSCYCIFRFQYSLTITNFILISLGIFTINIIASLIFVILFEIPIRRFTQLITRNIVDWDDYFKKEITNYDEK